MKKESAKRVLIISYHFYPDTAVGARRPTKFMESLIEAGYQVDVLTKWQKKMDDNYPNTDFYYVKEYRDPINAIWFGIKKLLGFVEKRKAKKTVSNNEVELSSQTPCEVASFVCVTRSYLRRYIISFQSLLSGKKLWTLFSIIKLVKLKLMHKHYIIILSSSPPSAVNLTGLIAKYIFKAKWICDLRDPINDWDLYPASVTKARVTIEDWLEIKYLKNADMVLVTTPSYKEEVREKLLTNELCGGKLFLIFNGYDVDNTNSYKITGSFLIVHAGTIYMNRDPFPFLNAIKFIKENNLLQNNKLDVRFYGDCRYWRGMDLLEWIEKENISEVISLYAPIPLAELRSIYSRADILLAFAQGQARQIPAKIFEYMGYIAKILVISEKKSDTAKLLLYSNAGEIAENKDEIVKRIVSMYKNELPTASNKKSEFSRLNQNKLLIEQCENILNEY